MKSKTLKANISKTKTPEHLWDPSLERGSQNTHFKENFDRGSPLLNKRITRKRSPISKWNPVTWAEKKSITLWYDVINDWKIIWKDWFCIWTRSRMIVKTFKIVKLRINISTHHILDVAKANPTTLVTEWKHQQYYHSLLSLIQREQRLVTSRAHPKGTAKNAQKTPNFDFSQGRDLRQFSLLMFPYLHAKNQQICRFYSQAIWQSAHF